MSYRAYYAIMTLTIKISQQKNIQVCAVRFLNFQFNLMGNGFATPALSNSLYLSTFSLFSIVLIFSFTLHKCTTTCMLQCFHSHKCIHNYIYLFFD